ncbi:MAG: hypothetical protein EXR81_07025, partial [Gammaproteobacteria bacterium]|nr:hypothetical protein [Gammaproteobacteria bacterium]
GTLKPNIGHLDAAAGVAGLIKTVLCLKNKILPPAINFKTLNKEIFINDTPFYINLEKKPWNSINPRTAGVSSFGLGGTNAHVILQEYASPAPRQKSDTTVLLVLSAQVRSTLIRRRRALIQYIQNHPEINLTDIAFTLQVGRKAMKSRFACICSSKEEAIARLGNLDEQEILNLDKDYLSEEECIDNKKVLSIAKKWLSGADIDWSILDSKNNHYRIPLPTYPFESREYWLSSESQKPILKDIPNINKNELSIEFLESKILDIFKYFLGSDNLKTTEDIYDHGGDSLLILQILAKIKKDLGVNLEPESLENYSTAKNLAVHIKSNTQKST